MRHMHHTREDNYKNRTVFYHDHYGNQMKLDDGTVTHDHAVDEPKYIDIKPRFLPPVDDGGAD